MMYDTLLKIRYTGKFVAIALVGLLTLLMLFSAVWQIIVRRHVAQFDATISPHMAAATQEAFAEKAAYEAAEFRVKRLKTEAWTAYEIEKLRLQTNMLARYAALKYYSVVGLLSVIALSALIMMGGLAGANIRQASVCMARIGRHSEIPVHLKDLPTFYPIAVNLSLAEIQASASNAHETAYQISRQMLEDITTYTRALAGKRGLLPSSALFADSQNTLAPAVANCPTFAELLQQKKIAPDKPLICGFDQQGQPLLKELKEIKTLAVTGLQGSGKTLSMAYLVAAAVVAYRVQVYVIDPHKEHPESLASLLAPLEKTGYVTLVNPIDTPRVIKDLHRALDRRLNGEEACTPGILLVIDELARLSKMDCFNVLLAFLERCTEETRKANMTFIGSSPKWTARHFNNRADIRRCMNAVLVHKSKPSQADLLLEDSEYKQLVKELEHPGEAVFATDYGTPTHVSMPLCTRSDMQTVAQLVGVSGEKWLIPPLEEMPQIAVEEPPVLFANAKRKKAAGRNN